MSKKFINNPANVVNEMLEVGMARERYRKSRGQGYAQNLVTTVLCFMLNTLQYQCYRR